MRASRWISVSWPPIRTRNVAARPRGRTRNNGATGATASRVICHKALQNQARSTRIIRVRSSNPAQNGGYIEIQFLPQSTRLLLP
jgi:hypothetical protein